MLFKRTINNDNNYKKTTGYIIKAFSGCTMLAD